MTGTICKAQIEIVDTDRHVYQERSLTVVRHPSETDERMMVRLLALALTTPADDKNGTVELAKSLWDDDEPDLWHRDLTGHIVHWITIGQPDEKRILKACGRADQVTVYAFGSSAPTWWSGVERKLSRARNLEVWHVPAAAAAELGSLAGRSMRFQVTVQDGTVWVRTGDREVELQPDRLR